jgi:hypothetical protein
MFMSDFSSPAFASQRSCAALVFAEVAAAQIPAIPFRRQLRLLCAPDQGVAFAFLIIEQIRVDRRVERGIIALEREAVTALFGTLRPGGPISARPK